jgi:hypothetical protein
VARKFVRNLVNMEYCFAQRVLRKVFTLNSPCNTRDL